jgi:hypothetical protein
MRSMITQERDKLTKGGWIRKKGARVYLARRTVVPAWLEDKSEKEGSALEEPGIESGGNQEKTGMAPKR